MTRWEEEDEEEEEPPDTEPPDENVNLMSINAHLSMLVYLASVMIAYTVGSFVLPRLEGRP